MIDGQDGASRALVVLYVVDRCLVMLARFAIGRRPATGDRRLAAFACTAYCLIGSLQAMVSLGGGRSI